VAYKAGKFGGWVSENYLAVSRLLTWLYSCIDNIAPDATFEQPESAQSKWSKCQNALWLSIRGLSTSGTASELRESVKQYMNQQGGPPPVLPPAGGNVQYVMQALQSLKAMIARVMASTVSNDTIGEVDHHIRIFLSTFHIFDSCMQRGHDKPTWLSSYNFLCLMNIPQMLFEYGPVRNLWEGGGQGEKIIGLLKPLWFGYRKNWATNLLTNLMNVMAIERVASNKKPNDYVTQDEDIEDDNITISKKMVHKYKSLDDVTFCFYNRKPLSMVQLHDGRFGCILRQKQSFVELYCGTQSELLSGSWYHNWSISEHLVYCEHLTAATAKYCLMLPKLTSTGMPARSELPMYTVITSEWMEINKYEQFTLPTIMNNLLNYNK
jgi:hypothetical protein